MITFTITIEEVQDRYIKLTVHNEGKDNTMREIAFRDEFGDKLDALTRDMCSGQLISASQIKDKQHEDEITNTVIDIHKAGRTGRT